MNFKAVIVQSEEQYQDWENAIIDDFYFSFLSNVHTWCEDSSFSVLSAFVLTAILLVEQDNAETSFGMDLSNTAKVICIMVRTCAESTLDVNGFWLYGCLECKSCGTLYLSYDCIKYKLIMALND